MEKVSLQDLQVHPMLRGLEKTKRQIDVMSYLLEKFGQIQPIFLVREGGKYYIVDGLIRSDAARNLGWDMIGTQVVDWSADEISKKRSSSNHSSKRTHWNIAMEAHMFINELVGKQRGKKRDRQEVVKLLNSTDESDIEKIGGDIRLMAIEFYGLNFKKSTLGSLMTIYDLHQDCPQELSEMKIFEKLDNGELTIHKAKELTVEYFQIKKDQGNNAITDVINYSRNPINKDTKHPVYCHTNEDLSFLEDNSINAAIVSPGYLGKQAKYTDSEKNFNGVIHGNEKNVADYIEKEVTTYRGLKKKLKKDGSLFVIIGDAFRGDNNCIPERLVVAMINDGWNCPSRMFWLKANQKPQNIRGRLQPAGEHILHFTLDKNHKWREFVHWTDGPITLGRTTGEDYIDGIKRQGYYWKKPVERFRTFIEEQKFVGILKHNCFNVNEVIEFGKPSHPCPYPINLGMFLILQCTSIGDTVADICGGIGSLSHGAKILHRNSISIDIDPVSSRYAANRIASCDHHVFTNKELEEFESMFISNVQIESKKAA
jgi:DNA modification methylase